MKNAKRSTIILILLLWAANLLALPTVQEAELKNIVFQKKGNEIEVTIEYPPDIPYDSFSLMNPNRLVMDFMGIRTVSSLPMIEINEMGIVGIRSALNRPGVARVVFNFTDETPQYRIEETETGLTVTFWKEQREADLKMSEERLKEEAEPAVKEAPKVIPETKKPVQPQKKATPYLASSPAKKNMAIGFSSGFQAFQDESFKEIYGEGGVFFRGEYSFYLPLKTQSIDIWTGFSLFKKTGKTTISEENLELKINTLSLALRYLRRFSKFTPFVGAGIDYVVYDEKLPEDFMIGSVGGSDLGFHVQAGTYFDLLPNLSLKVSLRYLFCKTTEDEVEVNLGGIEYGLGLVYRFDL